MDGESNATTNGNSGVTIKINTNGSDTSLRTESEIESIQAENAGLDETGSNTENPINVSQLSALGLENLTPDQAKELLCLLQQTGSIPGRVTS